MKKTLYIDIESIAGYEEEGGNLSPIRFAPQVFQYLSRIVNEFDYALVLCVHADNTSLVRDVTTFCLGERIIFEEVVSPENLRQRLHYKKDEFKLLVSTLSFEDGALFEKVITITAATSGIASDDGWSGICKALSDNQRKATVIRKTLETDIQCYINLDGDGANEIATGLGFFDHMLQQIARHGDLDLNINVKGDLHIDEHHTIEDVGLALGAAFYEALGNKKGIERYGFLLPMDDCLAQVAIDFGGRPWLVWEADFKREKVGDMPTEMFHHFFKSFSDAAKCNLNIKAEGSNEHHKIESIFKAFAKSIRMAVTKNNNNTIPSTKGSL